MPDLFFPVTEASTNILDPLDRQISEAVLRRLNIRQYFDNGLYYFTPRTAASLADDGQGNINLSRNRCDITVETNLNPATVIWDTATPHNQTAYGVSPTTRNEYTAIFHDPIAQVGILERTMPAAKTFSFKMKFLSYDAAQVAFFALTSQNHGSVVSMVHDVVYGYPIGMQLLLALSTIHSHRRTFEGDFPAYLKQHSTVEWHRDVRKLDLGQPPPHEVQLTVQRQQLRCQALLEFTQGEPEPDRVGNLASAFTIEFTYKVQFGCPNLLQMVLPCVVENNVLPETLFWKERLNAVDFLQNRLQEQSFQTVARELAGKDLPSVMLRLPHYDDFIPPLNGMLRTAKYQTFVSAVLTLDIPGPTIIPFETLGNYKLHPTVVEIIKLHSAGDLLGFQGIFNLSVFADNLPLDPSLITIDPETLTVTINATLLGRLYRLVLSETTDLRWVLPKWYPTLLANRFFFPMTIERNLNILLRANAVQITADPNLIALVARLMHRNQLEAILRAWVSQGEASYRIFSYTQTPRQFADYIALTTAHRTPNKTLYDLFIVACLTANYITTADIPGRSLRTPTGLPYGPSQGGFDAFSLPLRVFNVVLEPNRQPEHAG